MTKTGTLCILLALTCLLAGTIGSPNYKSFGCFKTTKKLRKYNKEKKSQYLDGNFKQRTDPIRKCYQAAKATNPPAYVFAIVNGGKCFYGDLIEKLGRVSTDCSSDGTGARYLANVYKIMVKGSPNYKSLGCFETTKKLRKYKKEKKSQYLDGNFKQRTDPIRKCYQAAKATNPPASVFAIVNRGKCFYGDLIDKLGKVSLYCAGDGSGGRRVANVYKIMGNPTPSSSKAPSLPPVAFSSPPPSPSFVPRSAAPNPSFASSSSKATRLSPVLTSSPAPSTSFVPSFAAPNPTFAPGSSKTTRLSPALTSSPAPSPFFVPSSAAPNPTFAPDSSKATRPPHSLTSSPAPSASFVPSYAAPNPTFAPGSSKATHPPPSLTSSPAPSPFFVPSSAAPNPTNASVSSNAPSLPPAKDVDIRCAEKISIEIKPNQLSTHANRLHLSDMTHPYCSATKKDGVFTFHFGLTDCGTNVSSTENYIVYENSIRVDNNFTIGKIQRQHEKSLAFRCRYNRKTKLNNVEFSGAVTEVQYMSEKFGKFDLFIELFKEDTFSEAVRPNDPIDVLKTVYARLKLKSSSQSLKMAVQSCIATPHNTPPDNATYTHDLINSRCFADSTVGLLETKPKEFRFKFQSFVFAKLGETVFIHCTVVVCKVDETTKTCSNPSELCSKRSGRSSGIDGARYTEYAITHGPFKQIKVKRSLQVTTKTRKPAVKNWRAISAAVSGGFLVILVATIIAWRKKSRQVHRYKALNLNSFSSIE